MAGTWVSAIGVLVGSTVAVLIAWATVGTCLGSLAAVFLVLLDGGVVLRAQPQVSLLFGVLIAGGIAFSWFKVCVCVWVGGLFFFFSGACLFFVVLCWCAMAASEQTHVFGLCFFPLVLFLF